MTEEIVICEKCKRVLGSYDFQWCPDGNTLIKYLCICGNTEEVKISN